MRTKKSVSKTPTALSRQGASTPLRLVKSPGSDDGTDDAGDSDRPGLRNPFVKMMNAYADAIDREVEVILSI